MSETNPSSSQPSFLTRLVGALVRLLLVLIVGIVLGGGGYFVLMYVLNNIQPAAQAPGTQATLEARLAKAQNQVDERLAEYNQRITALESRRDLDAETLSELQAQLEQVETPASDERILQRLSNLENLAQYIATQTWLQPTPTPAGFQSDESGDPFIRLQGEVRTLKAMELMSRARLHLLRSNFGQAAQDIDTARRVLEDAARQAPYALRPPFEIAAQRLGMAQTNLPDSPVQAAEDLEVAWQVLVGEDWLAVTPQPLPTTRPTVTPTPTSTPTETPESKATLIIN